jgi:hypothetical protein
MEKLQELMKKKWFLPVAGAGLFIIVLTVTVLLTSGGQQNPSAPSSTTTGQTEEQTSVNQPTQSPELKEALSEANQSAQEYDGWQKDNLENYKWLRKLPIGNGKYFVYFDLNKRIFIGKLYPKSGDDVEKLKEEAMKKLKERDVDTSKHKFEWSVFPR